MLSSAQRAAFNATNLCLVRYVRMTKRNHSCSVRMSVESMSSHEHIDMHSSGAQRMPTLRPVEHLPRPPKQRTRQMEEAPMTQQPASIVPKMKPTTRLPVTRVSTTHLHHRNCIVPKLSTCTNKLIFTIQQTLIQIALPVVHAFIASVLYPAPS